MFLRKILPVVYVFENVSLFPAEFAAVIFMDTSLPGWRLVRVYLKNNWLESNKTVALDNSVPLSHHDIKYWFIASPPTGFTHFRQILDVVLETLQLVTFWTISGTEKNKYKNLNYKLNNGRVV